MMCRALATLVVLVMLASCGEGRQGIIITGDGSLANNTPERAKARAEEAINTQVKQFQATAAIVQLPRWQDESRVRDEGWYWDMVQVDVTVPASMTQAERDTISKITRRSMAGAVIGGSSSLQVVIHDEPAVVAPIEQPTAPIAPPSLSVRRYMVQSGDTLADISMAFYGTTQYWRAIMTANPDVDPATMTAGMSLIIPPKP